MLTPHAPWAQRRRPLVFPCPGAQRSAVPSASPQSGSKGTVLNPDSLVNAGLGAVLLTQLSLFYLGSNAKAVTIRRESP